MGNIFLHVIFFLHPSSVLCSDTEIKKKKKPQVMRKLGEDALSDLPGWLLPREHSNKTLMLRVKVTATTKSAKSGVLYVIVWIL